MITNKKGVIRLPRIFGQTPQGKAKLQNCIDFVFNRVSAEVKKGKGTKFNAQTLFGGANYNWCQLGYPIGDIWIACDEKYDDEGYLDHEERAVRQAGIYVGYILKYVCHKLITANIKMKSNFCNIEYEVL